MVAPPTSAVSVWSSMTASPSPTLASAPDDATISTVSRAFPRLERSTRLVSAGDTARYRAAVAPTYRQHRFRRPPGATEVFLVRHGESEPADPDVPFPLVDGHGDPALAPNGREQSEHVASRLCAEEIDAVYVTTLRRTVQTAAPFLGRRGIEATVEPDLREVFLGVGEGGRLRHMVATGDPDALALATVGRWDALPGAESEEALAARTSAALNRIAATHPNQRVAAFTHGGVIGQLVALATGGRPFAFSGADNGSITHLVVAGDRWTLRRFNDTGHLPGGLDLQAAPGLSADLPSA